MGFTQNLEHIAKNPSMIFIDKYTMDFLTKKNHLFASLHNEGK